MTLFDAIILGISFLSALMGVVRGLTREVLGLASWAGGASLTFIFMPFMQIIARRYIQNGMMADIAAAVGLFVLFLILFSVISNTLSGLIRHSILGGVDRSLGFLFGIGRGIIILCIFQLLVSCFIPRHKYPESFENNRFAPMIYKGGDIIISLLPHQISLKFFEQQEKIFKDINNVSPHAVRNTINNTLNGVVNNTMNGMPNNGVVNAQNYTGFATPAQITHDLKQPTTAQQEAENLARLQPKAILPSQVVNVTVKQKNDLDRFVNLQDVDEEGAIETNLDQPQQSPAQQVTMPPVYPTMPYPTMPGIPAPAQQVMPQSVR